MAGVRRQPKASVFDDLEMRLSNQLSFAIITLKLHSVALIKAAQE